MNGDRHVQGRARLPHRVEPRVVDADERPAAIAIPEVEAERLQHLQAAGTGFVRPRELVRLEPGILGLARTIVEWLGERQKTAGVGRLELAHTPRQAPAGPAGEVDHRAQIAAVHDRQKLGSRCEHSDVVAAWNTRVPSAERQVRVDVDSRIPRARHRCLGDAEHAAGLELAEVERLRRACRGALPCGNRMPEGGVSGGPVSAFAILRRCACCQGSAHPGQHLSSAPHRPHIRSLPHSDPPPSTGVTSTAPCPAGPSDRRLCH